MEKEIVELLKRKMTETDICGMEVFSVDINDINALAKELNDLFALNSVGIELKDDKQRFSTDAINLVDGNNDSYVLDNGKLYKLQNVSKYILVN